MDHLTEDDSQVEDLLDPIRPSDGYLELRDNMSYVYGRDPSILSHGHRPVITKESQLNLLSAFEEESICHDSVASVASLDSEILSLQTVKVYLRMKPFTSKTKLTKEEEEAYKIDNKTTLLTKLPCLDNTSVSMKKNSVDTVTRKFTFTETFGPEVQQLAIFDQAMKPMLVKFLAGQNCTAMTYGTTNSGKSYTLQGTSSRPGIIPRSLEYVFANINPRSTPCYKPIHNCDVVPLSSCEKAQELEIKTKLLAFSVPDRMQYISAYKQMQKMLEEESSVRESQSTDAQYLVWVSFTEIYNETIYDLLSNDCQKRRPPLKLASDSRGRPFIKGLKHICVNSGSEAYQVLMAGQYNLKVAATALNSRSSRSHCIFTITVLKYYVENKPDSVEISQFSFCDLAGSERLKKTLNVGDRLKEAQNINTSLLVFGRCLKSIYEGQCIKQRNEHAGPFRDSKLTRLFQNALSGKEHMALIVNVNPSPNLYVETQNVLNLAAIAKKIVIEPKKIKRRKNSSRFSLVVEQTQKTTTDWDEKSDLFSIVEQTVSEDDNNNDDDDDDDDNGDDKDNDDDDDKISITSEDYQYLMEENEKLNKEIAALKSSILKRDMDVRQEMAKSHLEKISKLEAHYQKRLKDAAQQRDDTVEWSVKKVEDYYLKKLDDLRSRKRRRTNDDNDADDEEDDSENENEEEKDLIIDNLKAENEKLINKLDTLKATNKDLRKEKDTTDVEKNAMAYELSIAKKELKDAKLLIESMQKDAVDNTETNSYINELKSQLEKVQDNNKHLKQMLNEAKSDFISINDDLNKKDKQIHELEKAILLANEEIHELRDLGDETNALYDKKMKENEMLEKKLAFQDEKVRELKEQINVTNSMSNSNLLTSITIKQEVLSPRDSKENESVLVELQQLSIQDENKKKVIDELQKKLDNTEAENSSLNEKLNEKLSEIESLKNDVTNVKIQLDQVTQDLDVFKNRAMIQEETKDQSKDKSSNEIDCQTSFMDTGNEIKTDINCQTSFHQETNSTSSQTIDMTHSSSNKSMQTSIIDDELEQVKINFNNMKINFEDLNNQYSTESTISKILSEQLEQEKKAYKVVLEEKKIKENELKELKEDCESKHLSLINKLEKKLAEYEKSSNSASQVLVEQKDSLEKRIQEIEKLKAEITDLNEILEQEKNEKKEYQIIIENNERQIKLLEVETESLKIKEKEHEIEITRLEKSYKSALSTAVNNEEITRLEKEAKNSLKENESLKRELKITREVNDQFQSQINTLEARVRNYEMSQAMSDNYQRIVNDQKKEIKELKSINERLINVSDEKEKEMDEFKKNRQEMAAKYETLVTDLQTEIKLKNREISRLQAVVTGINDANDNNNEVFRPPPSSDKKSEVKKTRNNNRRDKEDHTSDDDSQSRRPRRAKQLPAKYNVDQASDMSIVELSGSESKRSTRRGNNPAPLACPSTEKRRGRTVKKLFNLNDDGLEDIEVEEDEPSPAAARAGLRPRRR